MARLLRELTVTVPNDLIEKGRVLDNFYVPSRYPNGHPEGAPFEHYGPIQSGEAPAEDLREKKLRKKLRRKPVGMGERPELLARIRARVEAGKSGG